MADETRRQFIKDMGTVALGTIAISGLVSLSSLADSDDKEKLDKSGYEKSDVKRDARLIFACSGAADVGDISDRVARKLMKEGIGKMYCMTGIGAGVEKIIETTKAAEKLVAIDGCPMLCASKCLKKAGFESKVFSLAEMGFVKGQSPANEENIGKIFSKVKESLT